MVNDLHVNGRPDIFRPGFCRELREYLYQKFDAPGSKIIVVEKDGVLCGFAMLNHAQKPQSPYNPARDYLEIEEFGVDAAFRRMGVTTAMVNFCKMEAKRQNIARIELNMWEFNQSALAFYDEIGFSTFRRYMELDVQ